MLKKIVLIVLCALPLSLFAQDAKLGHVNFQEIVSGMPELDKVEKDIAELNTQWKTVLTKMQDEYTAKVKEYQDKQATMAEGIKTALLSEIQDIEQRVNTFQQTSYADLQKKQQELVAPVLEKVKKAIKEVGTENNYTYIFDMSGQTILFNSPKSNDITPLVKKKLGIIK